MSDLLLERLARLDTCAVSDALDRAGLTGAALGLHALTADRRIVGRAVTVQLGVNDGRPPKRHLCTAAVEAADTGSVIVIANDGRTDVAGWGGILSLAASSRGIAGVVIDGASRDLDESRELALPIYGRAGVPVTARGRIIELDWNVPVAICNVTVTPGDYLIADGSGVVFIPSGVAAAIISTAEQIAERERLMAADIRGGKPVSAVMGASYESMLNKGAD